MSISEKKCTKRLIHDLEEIRKSPDDNVSAAPLEDNILEWHCNIRQKDVIFHLILFFPTDYPSKSPSAEFVPPEFSYEAGATKRGKKGTQICLSIFSDFEMSHTEWATEKGHGWSPGYTVKTILMNVISFLSENTSGSYSHNLSVSQKFTCKDCGHCYNKPYPSLGDAVNDDELDKDTCIEKDKINTPSEKPVIIDYYSKETFAEKSQWSNDDLFGYGIVVSGPQGRSKLTTPCEFLTFRSFYDMKTGSMATAHSLMKEELSFFLPLFIYPNHGSHIRYQFENVMMDLSNNVIVMNMNSISVEDMVLKTLPNLMCATLVHLFKEIKQMNENSLNGYFQLHRVFLWALDIYPGLQEEVETILKGFVEEERKRTKIMCPDIGQWLMLLAASKKYHWYDVAEAYLCECSRRNVMWYIKDNPQLGDINASKEYRLDHTFQQTHVSRNLLAFQVAFLDVALPASMSREQIIQRYDENWGFPTPSMITVMKSECYLICNEIHTYADWYKILHLQVPTDDDIFKNLVEAVLYAKATHSYHFTKKF